MTTKIDLNDVTFLFPMRIDTIDRLENLIEVIHFIETNCKTHIHILEASSYNNKLLPKLLSKNILHTFQVDYDPIFHCTYYINKLVENAKTNIVAVWDGDVIMPIGQLEQSVNLLRNELAEFVFPYMNKFLDTSEIVRELYFRTRNINTLKSNEGKMTELYSPDSVGGGFFAKRKEYIESGIENESFYGWGRQDGERVNRWETLGYKVKRVKGPLYHFTHGRGINSKFHSKMQGLIKKHELERLALMSKNELTEEISKWN